MRLWSASAFDQTDSDITLQQVAAYYRLQSGLTMRRIQSLRQVIEIKLLISSGKPRRFGRQNISKQSVILHDTGAACYLGLSRFHDNTFSRLESQPV
jgi:hypothetical protein